MKVMLDAMIVAINAHRLRDRPPPVGFVNVAHSMTP
jgi:hypothetical protein